MPNEWDEDYAMQGIPPVPQTELPIAPLNVLPPLDPSMAATARTEQLASAMANPGMPGPAPLPAGWNPGPILPPGYGVAYSTTGPADFRQTRAVTLPGGVTVNVPANAGNVASTYAPGPSPEDQQWQEMQKRFGNLPIDQALSAISAAGRLIATRAYQKRVASNEMTPDEALRRYLQDVATLPSTTATQGAALMRSMARRPVNVGGTLYGWDANGNPIPLTEPRVPQVTPAQERDFALRERALKLKENAPPKPGTGEKALEKTEADVLSEQLTLVQKELMKLSPTTTTKWFGRGDTIANPRYVNLKKKEAELKAQLKAIGSPQPAAPEPAAASKKLTAAKAQEYYTKAGGDKAKARAMAKADGWEF